MKKTFLLSIILVFGLTCYGQLPDLVGEKATVKQLKSSYGNYTVEEGRLLDVGSFSDNDNIYLNASIFGNSLDYSYILSSNRNGVITNILYLYDNIEERNFNYLKSTIIKVHGAKYHSSESGISVYKATISGIERFLFFTRKENGKAIISFKL